MIITAIKQQQKNPERVSIFVDGKYAFSLSLDELIRERLKNRQELSEADLKRLKKLSEEGKLRLRALNWLLLRPHSEREFRDYMYRKKADKDLTDSFVVDFTARHYINDSEFARWWYEQRAASNHSNRYIRSELMKKGIGRDTIDELFAGLDDDPGESGELARLSAIINKKRTLPRYTADPQKFIQYLARQGFGYDDIKRALAESDETA